MRRFVIFYSTSFKVRAMRAIKPSLDCALAEMLVLPKVLTEPSVGFVENLELVTK